jgi:hypothetical protein
MTVIIKRLVMENPRRKGTAGWTAWNLLRKGMTVEQYLAAGGRRDHLRWDVDKGNCKLVDSSGKAATIPVATVSPRFIKGAAPVPRVDDKGVKRLKSSNLWTSEREWYYENVAFKDDRGEQRTMRGRTIKLMVYVSPKGNRYVRAAAGEKADLIIAGQFSFPDVRLRKLAHSAALRKVKRHRRQHTKEVKAHTARKQAKDSKKHRPSKTKRRTR